MTGGSAHEHEEAAKIRNSDGEGHKGKRGRRSKNVESVPDAGRISRSSVTDTIMAVGFLVLVTLVAFMAVSVIGAFSAGNRLTYWMIELIFALLCGGAGALVGGSAVVRSTLRIPGSPVHATLGGAISMVIVGFALAYLGEPPDEQPMYAIDIHEIPTTQRVGNDEYRVFVGAFNSDLSFTRDSRNVSIKIPARIGRHPLRIAVYRPLDNDLSQTFAICELTFETLAGERKDSTTMELMPVSTEPQFHLYFSDTYIEKTVKAALRLKKAITNESCVEGTVATKADHSTPLDGHFTLQPNSTRRRALGLARLDVLPRYSVLARDRSNIDPQDTQPDLPPQASLAPGMSETGSPAASANHDTVAMAVAKSPRAMPPAAAPPAPRAEAAATAPTVAAAPHGPAPPVFTVAPVAMAAPVAAPAPAAAAEPALVATGAPAAAPAPAAPAGAANAKSRLAEQVDAYIRGEDRDRTELYQSWSEVADYVVNGLRTESANGSKLVAPYLNLIANALNVIDDGRYLSPTLRPNWDGSAKPDRLLKNQDIPGFTANDYRIAVHALCSREEDVRRAAQRLVKLYPSKSFYAHLQALPKQADFGKCPASFVAETAAYYFYNRMVEYDGTFALDKQSAAWIAENYADGREWTKRGEQDAAFGDFTAMLNYARGLVLWDHGEKKDAAASFNQMLDSLRESTRAYPSNPQHIAAALKLIHEPDRSSKPLRAAATFTSPDRRLVSKAYVVADGGVPLYALPDPPANQIGKMKVDANVRVYLRLPNFDLVEGGGQIGWARRVLTSAAK